MELGLWFLKYFISNIVFLAPNDWGVYRHYLLKERSFCVKPGTIIFMNSLASIGHGSEVYGLSSVILNLVSAQLFSLNVAMMHFHQCNIPLGAVCFKNYLQVYI